MHDDGYRHEIKFLLNALDLFPLRARLSAGLAPDSHHADSGGAYTVRSLYFDDAEDSALHEKLNGDDGRVKFRIRYYNGDESFIRLEKKCKLHGLCRKISSPLTKEDVLSVLRGDAGFLRDSSDPLHNELYVRMANRQLRPRALVVYEREAFSCDAGRVRVTLDRNVCSGLRETDLFNRALPLVRVMPAGLALIEVKYSGFLPDHVRALCRLDGRPLSSYSKYAACRAV